MDFEDFFDVVAKKLPGDGGDVTMVQLLSAADTCKLVSEPSQQAARKPEKATKKEVGEASPEEKKSENKAA